jgi:hypothetical protein
MIREKELKNFKKVKNGGYVYVCLAKDNTVKIGITTYPYTRLRQIETSSGKEIINWYIDKACANYKYIENTIHKTFADNRLKGEWFDIVFESAVSELNKIAKIDIVEVDEKEKIQTLSLLKLALEVKYSEYDEIVGEYNLDKWIPTIEDIETIKNEIELNINFNNNNFNGDFNEYLLKYLNIINKDKYSIEAKKAMQDYYMDIIDSLGYFDMVKEILLEDNVYDFVKKVLGIVEVKRNLFVEKLLEEYIARNY